MQEHTVEHKACPKIDLEGNTFKDHPGYAVYTGAYAYTPIRNNLFVNNWGGIGFGSYSRNNVVNNTIDGGTFGVVRTGSCQVTFTRVINSIVWGNTTNLYRISADNSITDNNIDPMFVGGGDYHLLAGSPAIDTGQDTSNYYVTKDKDGVPRPQDGDGLESVTSGDGSDYDIGAYEYVPSM